MTTSANHRHQSLLYLLLLFSPMLTTWAFSASSSSSSTLTTKSDLAVIGVGVLGTSLCHQILNEHTFQSRIVTGITKSSGRHDDIRSQVLDNLDDKDGGEESLKERFVLLTMEEILSQYSGHSFKDVIFCAPPSGFEDYAQAVKDAATQLWSGRSGGGSFVFTSSGGVYEGIDGEIVNEESATIDPEKNPRQGRIVYAEKEAIECGGCVLRLAGLYTLERGAHNYWLEKCPDGVAGREDGIVNLLHYDDAASAAMAAVKVGAGVTAKQTYLISDGNPTTRKGICESALKSERYSDFSMPVFLGPEDGLRGKVYDGSKSNEALNWKPKYVSFDDFMTNMS